MSCIPCNSRRGYPIAKVFYMKQYLESIGFKRVGSCNCNGGYSESFENGKVRVDIQTNTYTIKKRNPVQWSTVSYGNKDNLQNDLAKYL